MFLHQMWGINDKNKLRNYDDCLCAQNDIDKSRKEIPNRICKNKWKHALSFNTVLKIDADFLKHLEKLSLIHG